MEIERARQELTNGKRCAGNFRFNSFEVVQIPTFADYIKSLIQINLIAAIGFTVSNGDPKIQVITSPHIKR